MAELKFSHEFDMGRSKKRVVIKIETMGCYPGGKIVNQLELVEKLRRAMTSEECQAIGNKILKKASEYAISLAQSCQ